jgi:hypothetical protein
LKFQQLSPISSGDGTFFPASFYHPEDFTFPKQVNGVDSGFMYLSFEPSYNYSAITEYGIEVNIGQ